MAKVKFNTYLEPEVVAMLKELAAADERTAAGYLGKLIKAAYQTAGKV